MAEKTIDIIQLKHPDSGEIFYPQTHAEGVIGLGTAAKTDSSAYATSTQGSHADDAYNLVKGNKNINTVLAGPASGSAGAASFRKLVESDIPNLSWSKISTGKPTTISGYGITDAKIENGTITLGNSTITPLVSHQTLYNLVISDSSNTVQLTYKPNVSGTYSLKLTKALVGLSNVEDTKLSTWTGTNKITTVGTITSGVWNGTKIGYNYLGETYIGTTRTQSSSAAQALTGISSIKATSATESLFEWDATNNAWHFKGGIYSDSFVSAGGLSDSSGTSGIDEDGVWTILDATNEVIGVNHIPNITTSKISDLETWIVGKGYVTSSGITSVVKGTDTSGGSVSTNNGVVTIQFPTAYTLPLAASGTRGGIKIGYTQSGKNYPVQLSSEKAYVNVPWTDTTYSTGTSTELNTGTSTETRVWTPKVIADYVTGLISAIDQFHYEIASSTSAITHPASNILYLIGPTGSGSDKYEEYVYTDTWVKIGDTTIDLSGYQPLDADLTAIAALTGNSGFLKKTAANTWTLDTNTYLTGITSTMVTTALGYTPANITALGNYVLKSGDTVSGWVTFDTGGTSEVGINYDINRADSSLSGAWAYAPFIVRDVNNSMIFNIGVFGASGTMQYAYLGVGDWNSTTNLRISSTGVSWGTYSIYHQGNLSLSTLAGSTQIGSSTQPVYYNGSALVATDLSTTYAPYNANGYLPLNGGTLTGKLTMSARIDMDNNVIEMGSGMLGAYNASAPTTLYWYNGSGWQTVWHSGNSNLSTVSWVADTMTANSFKLASGTPTLTWDDDANAWHLSGNFYADGFISAGGVSSGGGASGVDLTAVWNNLIANTGEGLNKKIHTAHLPTVTITGTNISGTATYSGTGGSASTLTLNLTAVDTKYTSGTGISLSGTTFSLDVAGAKTALGLGSNAYTSTAYLPLAGGEMNATAVISRTGQGVSWYQGRLYPIIKTTSYTGYNAILSMKTTNGSWDLGVYSSDTAYLTYITDENYSAGNNTATYQLTFPKASGTVALTSQIPTNNNQLTNGAGYLTATTAASTYVKFDPGASEQTIKSSISTFVKGVINLWRSSGDHYTFLGFSNGTTETYLGGIGFKSQSDHNLYRKDGSNYYKILDENNYTSYVNTTNFPGLNKTGTVTSVAAGTGLSGGTITTSGTISLATSGVTAGTYYKTTVDTYGRVTSGYYVDLSAAINGDLEIGTSNPTDTDYYIAQYAGGGSSTTSYHRRPHSALYNYINDKLATAHAGLDKIGTVTSITVTGNNGLSGTGTVTTSGTITLSNAGVRNTTINGNYLRVNTNGTNTDLTIPYATKASRPRQIRFSQATDLNSALKGGGIAWNYSSEGWWTNGPLGMSYGSVLEVSQNNDGLSAQFAWDIVHNASAGTNRLWYRAQNNLGWGDWAEIYTSKSLTQSVVTGLIGTTTYAPYNAAGYLPLMGGTLTGKLTIDNPDAFFVKNFTYPVTTSWARNIVSLTVDGVSKFAIGAYGSYTQGASDNGINFAYIGVNAYDGTNLRFGSDSTLKWGTNTIYHAGNANLSTVPWACSTLTASGTVTFSGGYITVINNVINTTSTNALFLNYYRAGNIGMCFGGGNVGIGTITPAYKLDVNGSIGCSTLTATSADFRLTNFTDFHIYRNNSGGSAGITYYAAAQTTNYWNVGMDPTGTAYGGRFYWYYTGSYLAYLTTTGNFVATGAITAGSASDARLKTNIHPLSTEAAKRIVMALNPVTFTWNEKATELYDQYKGDDLGMIAQEVEPYLPQAVGTIFEKYKRLDYDKVVTPLVKVAQDHETRIRQLEAENRELRKQLNMN